MTSWRTNHYDMMLEEVEVTSQAKVMMSKKYWVSISVNKEE